MPPRFNDRANLPTGVGTRFVYEIKHIPSVPDYKIGAPLISLPLKPEFRRHRVYAQNLNCDMVGRVLSGTFIFSTVRLMREGQIVAEFPNDVNIANGGALGVHRDRVSVFSQPITAAASISYIQDCLQVSYQHIDTSNFYLPGFEVIAEADTLQIVINFEDNFFLLPNVLEARCLLAAASYAF